MSNTPKQLENSAPTLSVGQEVWYTGGYGADSGTLKKSKIEVIGRKYFALEDRRPGRFFVSNLEHDGSAGAGYTLYLNEQEYHDKIESEQLFYAISQFLHRFPRPKIELSKLRQIFSILQQ